jgi:hypothetical protein
MSCDTRAFMAVMNDRQQGTQCNFDITPMPTYLMTGDRTPAGDSCYGVAAPKPNNTQAYMRQACERRRGIYSEVDGSAVCASGNLTIPPRAPTNICRDHSAMCTDDNIAGGQLPPIPWMIPGKLPPMPQPIPMP